MLFSVLKDGLSREQLVRDLVAGLVVGIVAIPLAIAFAIASGVSPEKGLITAVLAGFIVSAFGGSRVQIAGPTGAFIVVIVQIIAQYGFEGMLLATFMAGIILVILGLLRLGDLLRFIPHPLIVGFTTGIAVIIFSSQVKDFFGLSMASVPSDFASKWLAYFHSFPSLNPWAFAVGAGTVGLILLLKKLVPKIPGSLAAIIVSSLLVWIFKLPVETIQSRFGSISQSLPQPEGFALDPATIIALVPPALTIALLGALESLLSASVADGMIGARHRSNIELVAQGAANMVTALFGGLPATGAIARTATNIKSGGRSPLAGLVHSLVLLLVLTSAGDLAGKIPLACLAGILFVVAWNMSDIPRFIALFKVNPYEVSVMLVTFILTVFTDLSTAMLVGFLLANLLFMKRMSDSTQISPLLSEKGEGETLFNEELGSYPNWIHIFEINGPLFFGSVQELFNLDFFKDDKVRVLILRLRYVPILDSTGLKRLAEIQKSLQSKGKKLLISGASETIREKLLNNEILEKDALKADIKEALDYAQSL